MAVAQASFMGERDYRAVALSHFFVDVLNSSRTLLVAVLALSLGLSNAQVGLSLLLYNVGNALTQPFFGSMADRIGPRSIILAGTAWMIGFYSIAAVSGEWIAMGAITIAGLGSGAFHPSGTMVASQASKTARTQAISIFFMAGQLGLFAGPILTGIILEQYGRPAYLALPLFALSALASDWRYLSRDGGRYGAEQVAKQPGERRFSLALPRSAVPQALALAGIIICTGTAGIATINFAPVLFTEMGMSPSQVGLLAGLLMLGAAIGGVIAGTLADRIGGRLVIILSMLLAVVPIYAYVDATGFVRLILLVAAGFFVGMPHSILVLAGQNLLPGRRATASGVVLGFMFFAGSVGMFIIGIAADQVGLSTALQTIAVLPVTAAAIAFFFLRP